VSIVKINAITVPRDRFGQFEQRFATRAGRVSAAEGFERFQLLRPNDDRERCLVVTQWRSEDFHTWVQSADFTAGHAQHRTEGPERTKSSRRARKRACSPSHCLVRRLIADGDRPEASSPSRPSSAGRKSPVDSPRRHRIGSTSATFGERRA
jgi:heme-degrading monooxygenase HmoA